MLAYLKQIKLVEAYQSNYSVIINTLCTKIVSLIASCNAETVSVPVEALTVLARTDRCCAEQMGEQVLPAVLHLFSQYH